MTVDGVDYSWARPDPVELAQLGYRFACRYLSYDNTGKNLDPQERDRLIANGIAIVSNWEWTAQDALSGYEAGKQHAKDALSLARSLGMPEGRPIYFSVDFDMQDYQANTVRDYFDGVATVIDRDLIGIYGGLKAIQYAQQYNWAAWYWQTYAWSYGQWAPGTHIRQYQNGCYIAGGDCDKNWGDQEDIGQWGVDDMPSVKEVWTYDVDPSGGSYTASGAQWTTLNRTGYLANDFAPTVVARLDAISRAVGAQQTEQQRRTTMAEIALLLAILAVLSAIATAIVVAAT